MESGDGDVHLVMFGAVSWRLGEHIHPLPAGLPMSIVVALAEARGGFVRAEALADQLWSERPSSGLNALQRHVSRLRSHLRSVGVEPSDVLESTGSAYRLVPEVTTDLELIELVVRGEMPASEPMTGGSPCWWMEPLVGVPWEQHAVTRASLSSAASTACSGWSQRALAEGRAREAVAVLEGYVRVHPHDLVGWSEFVDAAVSTGDDSLVEIVDASAAAARLELGFDPITRPDRPNRRGGRTPPGVVDAVDHPSGYQILSRCRRCWADGDIDAAFEELDEVAAVLPHDVVRRLGRCLIWLPPEDDFARTEWSELVASAAATPTNSERGVVTLDAYALEQMADGLDVADREIEAAHAVPDLLRALRVRFLVGLGYPNTQRQWSMVDRLASIDHPDAEVEATRFAALLALKSGRLADAVDGLDRYAEVVARCWPRGADDFQNLAFIVLGLSAGAEVDLDGELAARLMPVMSNELTVDMATLWNRLELNDDLNSEVARFRLRRLMSTVPPDCAAAYELYFRLRTEGAVAVRQAAVDLAADIEIRPPQRHRHAAIVALGRWAVAMRDKKMADRVQRLASPWSGEYLGLWPCDTVIGPADHLIDALGAV